MSKYWIWATPVLVAMSITVGCIRVADEPDRRTDNDSPRGSSYAERRLALVIGNSAYQGPAALKNPLNDARALAETLAELDFTVTTVVDVSRDRMASAISTFSQKLTDDDVALFYFAGHGIEVDGRNYLIPTDYNERTPQALRFAAIAATDVVEEMQAARVAMVVLDACRNNPYLDARGSGTGLAPMQPRGTLIAYATGPGRVAADNPDAANGLFTGKLLDALGEPGLTVTEVFRKVRREVYAASAGEQWPSIYDDLLTDFSFSEAQESTRPTVEEDSTRSAASLQQETVFWLSIERSPEPPDFEAYLRQYPNGTYRQLAMNRLDALRGASGLQPRDQPSQPARSTPDVTPSYPLRVGTVFRECNSCPELVVQPGGRLALGRYEVTLGEYVAFAQATEQVSVDIVEPPPIDGGCRSYRATDAGWQLVPDADSSWRNPGFEQTSRDPVVCLNQYDVEQYLNWLSQTTAARYRLPTDDEWGLAARGTGGACEANGWDRSLQQQHLTTRLDSTQVDAELSCEGSDGAANTAPVGSYSANDAGLFDMVGNVSERVERQEMYRALYVHSQVARGGAWVDAAESLRSSARTALGPRHRFSFVGFRVARTLN